MELELAGIALQVKTPHIEKLRPLLREYIIEPESAGAALTEESLIDVPLIEAPLVEVSEQDVVAQKEQSYKVFAEREEDPPANDLEYEFVALYKKILNYLIDHKVVYLHGSLISINGNGYLFMAPSGTGKSTHVRLWKERYGDRVTVINDDNLLCLSEAQYDKLGNGKLQQGDVVVCIRGSLGKHGRFPFEKGAIASSLVIMRSQLVLPILDDFLMLYLDAPLFFSEIKKYDNGTAQPNLAAKSFEQFLFPLPPLVEQKRIVAKIEELLPLIERYEKAWSRLEDFNKRFPGDMQKSILQMAIQGKLVEQRPEEGTGEELYHQIQAEKQALIRTGKIKKDRRTDNLDIPQEDELPFDIPETWKWVYLGSVLNKLTDGTHRTPKYSTSGVKFVSVKDMSSGVLLLNNTKFITESEHKELFARCDPVKGDMLLSKVGTTGVPAIVDTDEPFSLFVSVALL